MSQSNYDDTSVYTQFSEADLNGCECVVPGLVSVKDCKGNVVGLLTPNDAEQYHNGTIDVPIGYVKVYNPITGDYVGLMKPNESQDYIDYLLSTYSNIS